MWRSHKPGWCAAVTFHNARSYLTSPPWLVPNYTAWWQRHTDVSSLPKPGSEPVTCESQVRCPVNSATVSPMLTFMVEKFVCKQFTCLLLFCKEILYYLLNGYVVADCQYFYLVCQTVQSYSFTFWQREDKVRCYCCVSRELLSAPTAGARCFVKHLEQLDKSSDVPSEWVHWQTRMCSLVWPFKLLSDQLFRSESFGSPGIN